MSLDFGGSEGGTFRGGGRVRLLRDSLGAVAGGGKGKRLSLSSLRRFLSKVFRDFGGSGGGTRFRGGGTGRVRLLRLSLDLDLGGSGSGGGLGGAFCAYLHAKLPTRTSVNRGSSAKIVCLSTRGLHLPSSF